MADRDRSILLTNDDGIESPGFQALYEGLSRVADVVAVAPADDQSAVGRKMSDEVTVHEHELGYAIDGTPADCTVAGLEALCPEVDMVVAGCNKGANLGEYVLGRSGTVSAVVEAAFFDVPGIAVSMYVPDEDDTPWHAKATAPEDYRVATEVTRYLVEHAPPAGVFERAEYLNVNVPMESAAEPRMEITRPSELYEMTADHEAGTIRLTDLVWRRMREGTVPDPKGTDRRAIVEGNVSVSPLTAPHSVESHQALDGLAEAFELKDDD